MQQRKRCKSDEDNEKSNNNSKMRTRENVLKNMKNTSKNVCLTAIDWLKEKKKNKFKSHSFSDLKIIAMNYCSMAQLVIEDNNLNIIKQRKFHI